MEERGSYIWNTASSLPEGDKVLTSSGSVPGTDPGQILSGFQVEYKNVGTPQRTEIFVRLGGSGGMLPWKILKIKHLRLVEIAFPSNIL